MSPSWPYYWAAFLLLAVPLGVGIRYALRRLRQWAAEATKDDVELPAARASAPRGSWPEIGRCSRGPLAAIAALLLVLVIGALLLIIPQATGTLLTIAVIGLAILASGASGGVSVMAIVASAVLSALILFSPLTGVWGGQGEAFMATIPLAFIAFFVAIPLFALAFPGSKGY